MKRKMIPTMAAALMITLGGTMAAGTQLVLAEESTEFSSRADEETTDSAGKDGESAVAETDKEDGRRKPENFGKNHGRSGGMEGPAAQNADMYDDWDAGGDWYDAYDGWDAGGDWYDAYDGWDAYEDRYDGYYDEQGAGNDLYEDFYQYWDENEKRIDDDSDAAWSDDFRSGENDGDADRKEALTEEEQNRLAEIEEEIGQIWEDMSELYWESDDLTEEEEKKLTEYEDRLDTLGEEADALYDKIEAYQMQKLVDDGTITSEEKDKLLSAYDTIEKLQEQITEERESISGIEEKIYGAETDLRRG